MAVIYQDYINTIKGSSVQRLLKIEILDSNYNIVDTITPKILSGNINFSADSGARRSATLSFDNTDGRFTPDPNGQFWMNTKYQIYTGCIVNDEEYYVSRGVFLSGEPTIQSQLSTRTVDLQLYDQWTFLDGTLSGALENTYIIPFGSNIELIIRQILNSTGETVRSPIIEPLNGAVTPYTIIAQPSDSYASVLLKLADMLSMVCYFDHNGYFRFESPANNLHNIFNAGSSWDFLTTEVLYLSGKRKLEYSKVKNHCIVVGANLLGTTYRASSSDVSPTSPTRIALIGNRNLVIMDDLIYSNNLAQQRSDYELQKAVQVLETIDIETIPIDILLPDNIVTVNDIGLGVLGDRYLIRSINFPLLNTGNMSMSIWKARSFT